MKPLAVMEYSQYHYYPFGLTMRGISATSVNTGSPQNKYKYNGKEEQRKEFTDGSGLEWLDYGARMYDNQVGRWMVVDPKAEQRDEWSTFNAMRCNPIKNLDPDGALDDDYMIRNNGDIVVKKTNDKFDRFYVETSQRTEGDMVIRKYDLAAKLEKNDAGLVKFPSQGTGFNRYGSEEQGGTSSGFKKGVAFTEEVGSGDQYLEPTTAAALFGVVNELSGRGITISFGDMSSSNGSDPANAGKSTSHHAGHGHMGKRSGLDADFRYVGQDGKSYQGIMSDSRFSVENNALVYESARKFGFDPVTTYQGATGTIPGVKTMGSHNNHGHLGFNRNPTNVIPYMPYSRK